MQCVVFVGIQAAGKSTFFLEQFFRSHVRISMDLLRTRHRERAFMQLCLATRMPFVVDNTNPRRSDRARYIGPAREGGFRIVGYHFDVPVRLAIARNNGRPEPQKIPVAGLFGTAKRLEVPEYEEGFDELHRVSVTNQGQLITPIAKPEHGTA